MSTENARGTGILTGQLNDENADLVKLIDDIAGRRSGVRPNGQAGDLDVALWRTLEEAGLTRLSSTVDLDAGPTESAVLLYGLARHAAAVPVAETDLMAAWLATRVDHVVPPGPLTIAVADAKPYRHRLRGTSANVPWARQSSAAVLAVRSADALRIAIVPPDELDIDEHRNLAAEPRDEVRFDLDVDRFTEIDIWTADELRLRGAWARCIQIVGAMDRAADLTISYVCERVQFGRPVSRMQAVQHSIAQMAGEIERTRAAVALAVVAASDHGFDAEETRFAVCVAKIVVGQTVNVVNTIAHQLHGALGVTMEHPLWMFTMRAQSWVGDYGHPAQYARELGQLFLAAQNPWDVLIDGATSPGAF